MKLTDIVKSLGEPYEVKPIDKGPAIYRKLDSGYEFEVVVISNKRSILYVWSTNPSVLVGVYEDIPTLELKDILGHYAFVYRKLLSQFRVERQDIEV